MSAEDVVAKGTAGFHTKFNAREFTAIYASANRDYQASKPVAVHLSELQQIWMRCGKFVETTYEDRLVKKEESGLLVAATYRSKYEKCRITEYFAFKNPNGTQVVRLVLFKQEIEQ